MLRLPRFPRTGWTPLLSALALLALLLGQGVSVLHMATASHVVCAEHGEAIEAHDEASAEAGHHGDRHAPGHHAHHECAVLHAWSIAGTPEFAADLFALVLEAPPARLPAVLASRPADIALWRIAPKHSPPHA